MRTLYRSVERELLRSSIALSRGQRLEDVQDIDADVPEIVELRLEAAQLHAHLRQLEPRLRKVIGLRYGLGCLPLSCELAARRLRITEAELEALELEALARLGELYRKAA